MLRKKLGVERVHGARGHRIGAGGAPHAEVDPSGMERFEGVKRLRDSQRRVVGQHDAARADADPRGCRGDVLDQDLGGRARDAGHAVVLGKPVAHVAELFDPPRQVDRVTERFGGRGARADRNQVEDGKRNRHWTLSG
jgi:hypothetical protein